MLKLGAPCKGVVTSRFGWRTSPKVGWHSGLDIANNMGTIIRPAYRGKVVAAGNRGNYGNTVIIEHPGLGRVWTLYAHLKEINTLLHAWLEQEDIVGFMGSTGFSSGPHLHLEVRFPINGIAFAHNPGKYLGSI